MSLADSLNVLTKWRVLFAGWQLGTRPKGDPEGDAVRDHREATILLRAEVSALTAVLLAKGVMTPQEYRDALEQEANELNRAFAQRFPGVTASSIGLTFDASRLTEINSWMKDWKP